MVSPSSAHIGDADCGGGYICVPCNCGSDLRLLWCCQILSLDPQGGSADNHYLRIGDTSLGDDSVEATIDVKPAYGLSDEQIAAMLKDSFATAQQDMQARALVEARVDADRMLVATHSALKADGQLLGYALTGAAVMEKLALNKQLPALLA